MSALVRLEAGRVSFDAGAFVEHPAVEVLAGERVGVVGANGSGKTTLLRVLAGLTPASASLSSSLGPDEIGYVGQRPFLFRRSVRENVALGAWAQRRSHASDTEVDRALNDLGLWHLRQRPARSLSEGQQVRVAIARALVRRPRLLVLDEVLAALDTEGVMQVRGAFLAVPGVAIVAAAPRPESLNPLDPTRVVRLEIP